MKVFKQSNIKKEKSGAPLFTGNVSIQNLFSEKDNSDFSIGFVSFPKNVRNKFHKHTNDQVLIVTKGKGFYKTKDRTFKLKEGDVAWSPAGEVHSHGAEKDTDFTHITITRSKTKLTQVEK